MEDKHLQAWQERLAGCEPRELTVDGPDLIDKWGAEQVVDFLGWTNESFAKSPISKKKTVLANKGVDVLQIEGKGRKAVFTVRIKSEMYLQLLTRKVRGLEPFMADYMNRLFTQNALLKQGACYIVPTVEEMADEYARMFNLNPTASRHSLVYFRKHLKKYGYITTTKKMMREDLEDALDQNPSFIYKQARAYRGGKILKGHASMESSMIIADAWAKLFKELDKTYPLVNEKGERLTGNRLLDMLEARRKDKIRPMIEELKETHGWSHFQTFYVPMLTSRARMDYFAIMELFYMGASFTDIRAFLDDREEYWKNEGQPVDEDDDDTSEEYSAEEEL